MSPRPELEQARARLHDRHRELQARNALLVAERIAAALAIVPDLSDESGAKYLSLAVPVVAGGQQRAATLGAAYIESASGLASPRPPSLDLARLVVTAATPWMFSPIIRARTKLAEGLDWSESITAAQTYAVGLSSGDLQTAVRFGLDAGAAASRAQVLGYRMVNGPDACEWCRLVSGETSGKGLKRYHHADGLPFHLHCHCSPAPIFADEI